MMLAEMRPGMSMLWHLHALPVQNSHSDPTFSSPSSWCMKRPTDCRSSLGPPPRKRAFTECASAWYGGNGGSGGGSGGEGGGGGGGGGKGGCGGDGGYLACLRWSSKSLEMVHSPSSMFFLRKHPNGVPAVGRATTMASHCDERMHEALHSSRLPGLPGATWPRGTSTSSAPWPSHQQFLPSKSSQEMEAEAEAADEARFVYACVSASAWYLSTDFAWKAPGGILRRPATSAQAKIGHVRVTL